MELNDDDLLIRRKRVDEYGEWEFECRYCDRWLPKTKFRGCVDYIDAYGNCLMCMNCRASKGQQTQKENGNHMHIKAKLIQKEESRFVLLMV